MPAWWDFEASPDPEGKLVAQENSLRLIDLAQQVAEEFLAEGQEINISEMLICTMHSIAMRGLFASAGSFRNGPATIANSKHIPPPHTELRPLVDEMCDVLNTERSRGPVWLAAYAMWRLNWIHPFEDGNGRTSRALSHTVLAIHLKLPCPVGRRSLPVRIMDDKIKYWHCLVEADRAYKRRPA